MDAMSWQSNNGDYSLGRAALLDMTDDVTRVLARASTHHTSSVHANRAVSLSLGAALPPYFTPANHV